MAAGLADFYPVLPILFVISLVLLVLPVWGFIRGRNTPVLFYIAWLFLGNAIYFVDMLVWHGSVIDFAPVYCDIISALVVMVPIGISCSLLCINILVWKISRSNMLVVTPTRRRLIIDTLICIGVPIFFASLHVLVQNKRFMIIEDVGCAPSTDQSIPALFIYYLPPSMICCCITSVFCARSIINFCRTRYRTNSLLPENAENAMSFNRYLRLILLCTTSFLLIATFLVSMVIQNLQLGFHSVGTWANDTWDFQHVEVFSRLQLDTTPHRKTLLLLQLLPLPVMSFHFFLFFGIGEEAMRNYRGSVVAVQDIFKRVAPGGSRRKKETWMSKLGKSREIDFYFNDPPPSPYRIPIIPPPIFIPPPYFSNRNFLLVEGHRRALTLRPSSTYLVPSPSVNSSRSSVSVSVGHFPYPPPHFFHEHPYAPYREHEVQPKVTTEDAGHSVGRVPNPTMDGSPTFNAGVGTGLDLNTGSTRSRFSVYSDAMNSPVLERRLTRAFAWGPRPTHSI